ncbi:MAG TPA: hydrogenase nickel incorporation protein HypB, partial [Anaerolineales bacterium]|nr:hydrogenase nickel incorporation protein HypB [Anaerolineales bacterium]
PHTAIREDASINLAAIAEMRARFPGLDLVLVENVGNLICPASFLLGTHLNVLIASIPEGDDKPYKYPGMYMGMQTLIINKIDLLPYVPFNLEYFKQGVEALNPGVTTFPVSSKTGEGMDAWADWLVEKVNANRNNGK